MTRDQVRLRIQPGQSPCLCAGVVNVTVNCCIWNELMFKKESVISANAYRCEVLVCEEKVLSKIGA